MHRAVLALKKNIFYAAPYCTFAPLLLVFVLSCPVLDRLHEGACGLEPLARPDAVKEHGAVQGDALNVHVRCGCASSANLQFDPMARQWREKI